MSWRPGKESHSCPMSRALMWRKNNNNFLEWKLYTESSLSWSRRSVPLSRTVYSFADMKKNFISVNIATNKRDRILLKCGNFKAIR